MGNSSIIILSIAEAFGLALAVFLWGLPLFVPLLIALLAAAMIMRGFGGVATFILGNVVIGAVFASILWGLPPAWIHALIGVITVIAVCTHLATPRQGGVATMNSGPGDQNPIPIFLMVVGIRGWLAFYDASATAITNTNPDPLDFLTIFVVGVVPDFPIIVNVLLFILANGSLILWLVLLAKRIANPLAN